MTARIEAAKFHRPADLWERLSTARPDSRLLSRRTYRAFNHDREEHRDGGVRYAARVLFPAWSDRLRPDGRALPAYDRRIGPLAGQIGTDGYLSGVIRAGVLERRGA